jgi:hypothetical protein
MLGETIRFDLSVAAVLRWRKACSVTARTRIARRDAVEAYRRLASTLVVACLATATPLAEEGTGHRRVLVLGRLVVDGAQILFHS